MKKGQYQLLIGVIILTSIIVSLGVVYYFSFKPKIETNQTTTTTISTSTISTTSITSMTTSSTTSTTIFTTTTQPITTTTTTTMKWNCDNNTKICEVYPPDGKNIQDAINFLSATGGKIFIKSGTYKILNHLSLIDNLTLSGEGTNTILQLEKGGIAILEADPTKTNITIESITLDGNKLGPSSGISGFFKNSIFSKLEIKNFADDGIFLIGSKSVNIKDCYFHDNALNGIEIKSENDPKSNNTNNEQIVVDDCHFENMGYFGVVIDVDYSMYPTKNNKDVTVTHSFFKNMKACVLATRSWDIFVDGNEIDSCSEKGVYFYQLEEGRIVNNNITNSYYGIALDTNITKTVVSQNAVKNSTLDNIAIDCTHCNITDNLSFGARAYGIKEVGKSDFNFIINNDLRGNAIPLLKIGANTITKDNLV